MCSVIDQDMEKGADECVVEIVAGVMRRHHQIYDEVAEYLGLGDDEKERCRAAVEKVMQS